MKPTESRLDPTEQAQAERQFWREMRRGLQTMLHAIEARYDVAATNRPAR